MVVNLIAGILTGFIVSIPPMGPISFAMISKGFKSEITEGRVIALGAAFMDFFYCLIAFSGISLIISLFPTVAADFYYRNAYTIEIVLTFSGCIVVIIYGLKIIRSKHTYDKLEAKESAKLNTALINASRLKEKAESMSKILKVPEKSNSHFIGLFFMGVFLCLSSLTLPASWIVLIGYLNGFNFLNTSFLGGLLFALGAFIGTFGWFYTLLKLISGNKKLINQSTVNVLNIFAGIILLSLGVFLFGKASISLYTIIIIL